MRFFWRSDSDLLPGYRSWLDRIDAKNREAGTSAPTLAAVWSGPLDLLGALATHASLTTLTVRDVTVEERATLDPYGRNVRNHDLVLRGATPDGDRVNVCVEARAGEPLGASVGRQAEVAEHAKVANPRSNAPARLENLVSSLCGLASIDAPVAALRYQLLTAWAGTLASAAGADHVVFALHEFRTDSRPADKSAQNGADLARFGAVVLGCDLPGPRDVPWCVRVPDVADISAALYVAHVVTDLRASVIRPASG